MLHKGTQTIQTDRLVLRKYETSDAEGMYRNWVTDREVTRFWGWEPHKSIEETRALLQTWVEDGQRADVYHWIIVLRSSDEPIGYLYLNEIVCEKKSCAIHYLLSRPYWNKGYMTEAVKGVIEFAFKTVGFKTIHSRHHVDNPASGRVLSKAGMQYIGTQHRTFPDYESLSGDYLLYSIEDQPS